MPTGNTTECKPNSDVRIAKFCIQHCISRCRHDALCASFLYLQPKKQQKALPL